MPVPARYILATVNFLIQQHGEGAPYVAAVVLDELERRGDVEGVEEWEKIVNTLKQLEAMGPNGEVRQ